MQSKFDVLYAWKTPALPSASFCTCSKGTTNASQGSNQCSSRLGLTVQTQNWRVSLLANQGVMVIWVIRCLNAVDCASCASSMSSKAMSGAAGGQFDKQCRC